MEPGSLAALAGIAPGTAILEVNRRAVGSPAEFAAVVGEAEDGVLLRLLDKGRTRQVSLRWR
ncbi:MAG: PDZ domain-containing protein [Thiobacillaceae bacterium]|nr:PDZ domain-containing protein [Thiobacillaceae bacterium]